MCKTKKNEAVVKSRVFKIIVNSIISLPTCTTMVKDCQNVTISHTMELGGLYHSCETNLIHADILCEYTRKATELKLRAMRHFMIPE